MNALLLPFVDYTDAGIKTGETYIGVYHFDMTNIQSIEPDEDGNAVIYHKYGEAITFAVPVLTFCKLLHDSKLLNYYFKKEVDKLSPTLIDAIVLTNKQREE